MPHHSNSHQTLHVDYSSFTPYSVHNQVRRGDNYHTRLTTDRADSCVLVQRKRRKIISDNTDIPHESTVNLPS